VFVATIFLFIALFEYPKTPKKHFKHHTTMKKGVLVGLAAVAVGVVVYSLNKKEKPALPYRPSTK
jgi:uncharacterized protein YjeT (DUF2065 family)